MDKTPNQITGQIFLRETKEVHRGEKGQRPLLIAIGVIAVPAEFMAHFKGEHQYTFSGILVPDVDLAHLTLYANSGVDRTDVARGCNAGSLLLEPIWRV